MGLPGEVGGIAAMPRSSVNPNHPVNIGGPEGLPGQYRVRFVFSRPGYALKPEHRVAIGSLIGNSHLAITRPAHIPPDPDADQILNYAATPDVRLLLTGFPNNRGFLSHIETDAFLAQTFDDAQQKAFRALAPAGLPKDLVMYCARHDFGTYALSHTGNLAAVMKTMGHRDVKTAMQYQHPELESVRLVINDCNSRHNLRHKTEFLQ